MSILSLTEFNNLLCNLPINGNRDLGFSAG